MATANDRLVWIDCEMTGLDIQVDELVEVAVVITDFDLVPVHPGFDIVIKPDQSALDNMNEFVTNMHTSSGLIDEIPQGVSLADAEFQVLEYILQHVPAEGSAPLAGNTIGTDRSFLAKYMPRVDGHLHYRSVDVSSIKELCRRWFPRVYFNAPEKHGGHRALADILESIRELEYYRRAGFVAEPGPTTEDVRAVAAEVVEQWAPRLAQPEAAPEAGGSDEAAPEAGGSADAAPAAGGSAGAVSTAGQSAGAAPTAGRSAGAASAASESAAPSA